MLAGRGRRLKSPARIEAILHSLRLGSTRQAAAQSADVAVETFRRWQRRDPELARAVLQAEAEAEGRFVARIAADAQTDWRAAAWWLERRRPETYGTLRLADTNVDVRRLAARIAARTGLDPALVIAEAERLVQELGVDEPD